MGMLVGAIVHYQQDPGAKGCRGFYITLDHPENYGGPLTGIQFEVQRGNNSINGIARDDIPRDQVPNEGDASALALGTVGTWHYLGQCPDRNPPAGP